MKPIPRATSATYDVARHRIEIELHDGSAVAIPVAAIDALADATPDQLMRVRASTGGRAIVLEDLDLNIGVPGLLHDLAGVDTGTAAALMGRKGGSAATDVKASAARTNGAKGGRPLTMAGFIKLLDRMLRAPFPSINADQDWASATWSLDGLSLYVKKHGSNEIQAGCSWNSRRWPLAPRSRATAQDLAEEFERAASALGG